MATPLTYLAYIGIILLVGLITMVISKKIKIPNFLLLIAVGAVLGNLSYRGEKLIAFDYKSSMLIGLAIFALALIVFDGASRFKLREFDAVSLSALKLSVIFLVINMVVLSALTYFVVKGISPLLAILFAAAMSGTSPSAVTIAFKGVKTKIFQFLEVESILNTPLAVLIPFLVLDLLKGIPSEGDVFAQLGAQVVPFLQQFITGIGVGILIGLIIFKVFSKIYHPTFSPLTIITAALITYVSAEQLGGNGVLAVTTLGLFFGNVYLKHKIKIREFSGIFSTFLEIIVFILIGFIIQIDFKNIFSSDVVSFFIISLTLFIAFLGVRLFSVIISFGRKQFTAGEKLYMTLNVPKGIAVAVVALTLITSMVYPGIDYIFDLMLAFLVYSIVLSAIVTRYSKKFIRVEAIKPEKLKP